ncbi:MAG: ABC transporter permease [Myxococcota bacterium]
MLAYLVRKLLLAVPLVVGVLLLLFLLVELSPGDACDAYVNPEMPPETIERIRATFGCDLPVVERFLRTVTSLASLDLGVSTYHNRPVSEILLEAAPNTLLLSLVTIVVAMGFGCAVGIVQALRHRRFEDTALSVVTLLFYSTPHFWLALMLILLFTPALPSSGMIDPVTYDFMSGTEKLVDRLAHLVLPGLAMGIASAAGDARYMRSSMLEVLQQDYVRTARAKGLPEHRVVLKHALRNALLPIVTLLGLNLPALFSGAVLIETVFAWPGMGRVIVTAIFTQDVPLLTGCFLVFTLLVVAGNLLADVLYAVVDPRIRYS